MFKKVMTLLLCLAMVSTFCALPVNAIVQGSPVVEAEPIPPEPSISPFTQFTNSIATTLLISAGQATSATKIIGYSGTTTKVTITMTLQKKGILGTWSNVTTWSQTFNSYSGSISKTSSISTGTYRVKGVYVAYSGSASETFTNYSPEKTY